MENHLHLFQDPPSRFRGAPFWAWNCKLDKQRMLRQAAYFKEMGFGGFTIHSRTGLDTAYLGKEFLEIVGACAEEAKRLDMKVYLYDEDRWPSGSCGGTVTKNPAYRSRKLVFSPTPPEECDSDECAFLACYRVRLSEGCLAEYRRIDRTEQGGDLWYAYRKIASPDPWYNGQTYVDTLNPEAVREFLRVTHEVYYRAFGQDFGDLIPSIFTDEPQFSRKEVLGFAEERKEVCVPYTDSFEDSFRAAYGESFLDHLPELFWELPDGKYSVVRYRYHDLLTELFARSFSDQIGAWCEAHRIQLTGHMMEEPRLQSQTAALGEAMRHYRGFQVPGIDMLCDWREYTTAKQAQSAAHQFGRTEITSELYGVTNWDFDFRGHKLQGDWQAALGVTHRVPHLAWASMEGEAKRDYPASIFYQSPWFRQYPYLEDYFARVNTALRSGTPSVQVGVIHPIESYWLSYGPESQTALRRQKLERQFSDLTEWLLFGLIDFDFISEGLLKDLPDQTDQTGFAAGEMRYRVIVVPGCLTLRKTTLKRLQRFADLGGRILFLGQIPQMTDAQPDDAPALLAGKSLCIPFDQSDLLQALEPYRRIDLRDEKGIRPGQYLYQLRELGEERLLFLANGKNCADPDVPRAGSFTVSVCGTYAATELCALTGEEKELTCRHADGKTVFDWRAYSQDSLLVRLHPADGRSLPAEPPQRASLREIGRLCEVSAFRPEEENVFLLDQAEYAVDGGEFHPREEILRIDTAVRRELGYPADGGSVAQPWTQPEESGGHTVTLRYRIPSDLALADAVLAAERPDELEIFWNGAPVPVKDTGWYVDESIRRLPLPTVLPGENTLLIRKKYSRRSSLEACYLLGNFGVRTAGSRARLIPPPASVCFSDLSAQGFPFYGGNFTYECSVDVPDGEYVLEIGKFRCPVISVGVDGGSAGLIALAPYRVRLGRLSGKHSVSITAYGNRHNTFGPLHCCDEEHKWAGPDMWRQQGSAFSYEYQFKRQGILAAPILYRLK